jgi:hypothetical protein
VLYRVVPVPPGVVMFALPMAPRNAKAALQQWSEKQRNQGQYKGRDTPKDTRPGRIPYARDATQ